MTSKKKRTIKSTIIGSVFIALAIYLQVHKGMNDYVVLGFFYISGVMLLLAPDKYIKQLEQFITNKVDKDDDKDKDDKE